MRASAGPYAAPGVTFTDTLPAGTTYDAVTTSAGSCMGGATVTCSLGTLTSAVIEGRRLGFQTPPIVAGFVVAGASLAALVAYEARRTEPMIDLRMFANRAFGGSLFANTIAMFAIVGNAVFVTQYLQLTLGMAPLRAALWSLVPSVAVAGAAPLSTILGARFPRGRIMSAAFVLAAGGFAAALMLAIFKH